MEDFKDISNWDFDEKTDIYTKYEIPGGQYEIHVMRHDEWEDILDADAILYLAVHWKVRYGKKFYSRRCLTDVLTVRECLQKAFEDHEMNCAV